MNMNSTINMRKRERVKKVDRTARKRFHEVITVRTVTISVIILILLFIPIFLKAYYLYVMSLICIYIILALGMDILLGYTGQFGLCHISFFGIGIYTYSLLNIHYGVPFILGILCGAILAAIVGFMIAIPAIRMRDIYLALATFAFGEFVKWLANEWVSLTNGPNGVQIPAAQLGAIKFVSDVSIFYLILIATFLMILLSRNIISSKFGKIFFSIRESEIAATACGVNVKRYKAFAFAISAFYAGIAGGMYGILIPFIHPTQLGFMQTIQILTMVIVGGTASIAGPIIGACALGALPELLREFVSLQEIIYGAALILFMVFMPDGIYGMLSSGVLSKIKIKWSFKGEGA